MTPRSLWKGHLKVGDLACFVSLHAAVSTSDRIAFHTINRATGHRVSRQFVDSESLKPVDRADQIKGYELPSGEYVTLTQDEINDVVPQSDKVLSVVTFLRCKDVDTAFFDKPYYLRPADPHDSEAFNLIRDGMLATDTVALAEAVLFRRARVMLIRANGPGLIGNTLNFDYEVKSAEDVFADAPKLKIKGEMLDLANHIIDTKRGQFDPSAFDDRYEEAVADLVKAKIAGKAIKPIKAQKSGKVVDLLEALRQSAGSAAPKAAAGKAVAAKAASEKAASDKAAPKKKAG